MKQKTTSPFRSILRALLVTVGAVSVFALASCTSTGRGSTSYGSGYSTGGG